MATITDKHILTIHKGNQMAELSVTFHGKLVARIFKLQDSKWKNLGTITDECPYTIAEFLFEHLDAEGENHTTFIDYM